MDLNSNLMLVRARAEHCDLLFQWANDPLVRKNAFNTNPINYEDHKKWFFSKLKSNVCFIFIAYSNQIPIGQIRVEYEEGNGIIDYSIDKNYRGKGYGTIILQLILKKINEIKLPVKILIGKVKVDNLVSQNAFKKAGYQTIEKKEYIEFNKKNT